MNADTLNAIDAIQTRCIAALDAQDMAGWLATFSTDTDASYICISAENEQRGHWIALMLDDSRARLEDRVSIVTKVWAGTYQAYRTRHFFQRLTCREANRDRFEVTSNFSIAMTPEGGVSTLLTTGVYHDLIEVTPAGALLRQRRAIYDADALPRYVVFPF
ncbi:aromatic-ring-hydroxylating dioxygenase subunit beta [uncultured Variovorax sp.]|jgi:anthranilate 1,2-dioxygenase small subunit|uniref:aromatic-ring-hydroxylating dioxygenase subunit beta n=1 Tax=uncultured Variovorax sp. TaxID=114708 RepID=UPI002610F209|nr:aromatic-ring-hydroxylating dioxygenase subunit beta [uncultured Variovorax sp.]